MSAVSPNQLDRSNLITPQIVENSGYTPAQLASKLAQMQSRCPLHADSIFEAETSRRDRDAPVAFNARAAEYRVAPAKNRGFGII